MTKCPTCNKEMTHPIAWVGRAICRTCKKAVTTDARAFGFDKWSEYGRIGELDGETLYGPLIEEVPVPVPEGKCGDYYVEKFDVTEEDAASVLRAHSIGVPGLRPIRAGHYVKLGQKGSSVWMSNTPYEIYDLKEFWAVAEGDVFISGLGIGMALVPLLANPKVKSITVVELSEDVIKLVAPSYPKVNVIKGDAYKFEPVPMDVVFHDIWPTIGATNYLDMLRLHKKWKPFVRKWQDSWCMDKCRAEFFALQKLERKYKKQLR